MSEQTEPKPKIYLFVNSSMGRDWLVCYAIAESGHILGNHVCSSVGWMNHDLHDREDRKATCEAHYPDGYNLVILPEGESPPDDVFERNQALGEAAEAEATAGTTT